MGDDKSSNKVTRRDIFILILIFVVVFVISMFYFTKKQIDRANRPVRGSQIVTTEDDAGNGASDGEATDVEGDAP